MSSDMQDLNVKGERTRRNIIRMGAIGASAVVANLGTINPSTAAPPPRRTATHAPRPPVAASKLLIKGYDDLDHQRQPQR